MLWLLKTEPEEWSWTDQIQKGAEGEAWSGVRNYQAQKYLKEMSCGDLCFFYHSGKKKEIVGIVEVSSSFSIDLTDPTGKFGLVWVRAKESVQKPVSLETIKAHPQLSNMRLLKQSRLSVMPVEEEEWNIILQLAK